MTPIKSCYRCGGSGIYYACEIFGPCDPDGCHRICDCDEHGAWSYDEHHADRRAVTT